MATTGHFGEYDDGLKLMAEAQRYKLRKNAHKGYLGNLPPNELLRRLKDEVAELEEAASRNNTFEMMLEAADIANFALGFVLAVSKPPQSNNTPQVNLVYSTSVITGRCYTCDRVDTLKNLLYTCDVPGTKCGGALGEFGPEPKPNV